MKEPELMTDEELRDLARDIVTNVVYIAAGHDLEFGFGALIALMDWSEWRLESVGAFYERYAKASPVAHNGHPVFFSAKLIHIDNLPALDEHLTRMRAALQ